MARKRHVPVKKKARKKVAKSKKPTPATSSVVEKPASVPVSQAPKLARPAIPGGGATIERRQPKLGGMKPVAGVPENIVEELSRTRGWVLLVAICLFVGSAGPLIMGVLTILGSFMAPEAAEAGAANAGALAGVIIGLCFVLAAVVLIVLGVRMVRYCRWIRTLADSQAEEDLEWVLGLQLGIWGLTGGTLLTLIVLAVIIRVL